MLVFTRTNQLRCFSVIAIRVYSIVDSSRRGSKLAYSLNSQDRGCDFAFSPASGNWLAVKYEFAKARQARRLDHESFTRVSDLATSSS